MADLRFRTTGRACIADADIIESIDPVWAASVHDAMPCKHLLQDAFRLLNADAKGLYDHYLDVELVDSAIEIDHSVTGFDKAIARPCPHRSRSRGSEEVVS